MALRNIDEHAFPVRPQTGFEGSLQVPALGAHARDEQPQVGRGCPDSPQRIQLGCADNEADVIAGVPGLGKMGDMFI